LVVLAAVSNLGDLTAGSNEIRSFSQFVSPGLGALELSRGTVDSDFKPEPTRAPDIVAGKYFAATDKLGSPADAPPEMSNRPEEARQAADIVLVQALRLAPAPGRLLRKAGTAPIATQVKGGTASVHHSCLQFRPLRRESWFEVQVPAGGLAIQAESGPPVQVYLRRFANSYVASGVAPAENLFFTREGLGRGLLRAQAIQIRPGHPQALRIPTDGASRPWHAVIMAAQPLITCPVARG
jgi:hypothetical protein